jgi:alkanesulfonate monooxygenase SsuD/methylene tetrahydromethanopterin reductase-like flavin-dependent oxidoreductase (luciferase family)
VKIGVNVPNFGPGTDPGVLRDWARTVEGLGFDLLMVSDHVVITPDVAEQYPAPFYEPFTTLSWLAGVTERVRLGTTVLIVPYRHPLLVARMAANLQRLSGGRLVLGVGVGWARQEFAALGVPFERRGRLTDEYLRTMRQAWAGEADHGHGPPIPIWVGGNSDAGLRRAVRLGDAWHPLRNTLAWTREALDRLSAIAEAERRPVPPVVPRIALRLTGRPLTGPDRLAGEGTLDQVTGDLNRLRSLGAETVVLDPFGGDPEETRHPRRAWRDLATVAAALETTEGSEIR